MLALCRMLLGQPIAEQNEGDSKSLEDTAFLFWNYFQIDSTKCPNCGKGHISFVNDPFLRRSGEKRGRRIAHYSIETASFIFLLVPYECYSFSLYQIAWFRPTQIFAKQNIS